MKKLLSILLLFFNLLLFGQSPTTFSWRNDQTPGNNADWTNTSPYYFWNGSTGAVPGGAEILFFDGNQGTTMTNNLSSTNRYRINFGSTSAASRTINGSTANYFYDYSNSIPAIFNQSGVSHSINFPIVIGNTSTSTSPSYGFEINAENGGLNIGSNITAQNNGGTKVLVLMESSGGSGSAIEMSGDIENGSGTLSLLKKNDNTATLSGDNNYTGTTTISGGTLIANSTTALGNGSDVTISSGATLQIQESLSVGDLTIASGATLTIASGKVLTVNGDLDLTGTLNLNGGILSFGTSGTFSTASSSNYIIVDATNGGSVRKEFNAIGSWTFHIGENSGTTEYSPISVDFQTGTSFSSANVDATVVDAKHPNNSSTTHYISRYWTLSQSGISNMDCDITAVYLDPADVTGSESSMTCGKYSAGSWTPGSINSSTNTLTFSGATTFSDITGGEPASLPVSLINFSAYLNPQSQAEFSWSTASELNASHFNVHRSDNGIEKQAIGVVGAQGNSNEVVEYTFVDAQPVNGQAFYFLEQVDFDGKTEWFGPVKVSTAVNNQADAVFGVNSDIVITLNGSLEMDRLEANLFDMQGQLIKSTEFKGDQMSRELSIKVTDLPSGMYMLYLQSDKLEQAIKLVK